MQLAKIKFCRAQGQADEWRIEGRPVDGAFGQWLCFDQLTLIVGKNATGKSKTIDVIRVIADLFSGEKTLSQLRDFGRGSGIYELQFLDGTQCYEYYLEFVNGKVKQEMLTVDGKVKLDRLKGKLWYEGLNEMLDFETDADILAVSKRDKKQHSFFETLYAWGKKLNHYQFGTPLGKNAFLRDIDKIGEDEEVDLKAGDEVTRIFLKGQRQFGDNFSVAIMGDMKNLEYDIKEINVGPLKNFPHPVFGLYVQEGDLDDITQQTEMSQGMFRALSLLVQLNYSLLSKTPSCILIDDIGEGLDYDRSKGLIDLIIGKVEGSEVQVIMTTNDRFVMNKVPLKYWSVIQRTPKKSIFYNYANSKEIFDEFSFQGLSNFDFLATDFYLSGFEGQES